MSHPDPKAAESLFDRTLAGLEQLLRKEAIAEGNATHYSVQQEAEGLLRQLAPLAVFAFPTDTVRAFTAADVRRPDR
jgi:hypothetical protein